MKVFDRMESNVQSYARSFPTTFEYARGAELFDVDGKRYIDFLAGAGSLNYGHNNPVCKEALIDYIQKDGVAHGLDMHTDAKADFLRTYEDLILKPRDMDYVIQFTGPTGANAVEAAIKLARKVTDRTNIVAFTNGFHGVTMGALAATGNQHHRGGAGVPLGNVTRLPYDGYLGADFDTLDLFEKMLDDNSSGLDMPAAVIFEAVQGEGGLNVASDEWLQRLEKICHKHDIKIILDCIQAGNGRTGTFFSHERSGIKPDIITTSKSLSAFGLPFAVVLIGRPLDEWAPGEHNGTFRGNNHAFVTATAAIKEYWKDDQFANSVNEKAEVVTKHLQAMADKHGMSIKGRGLMQGLNVGSEAISDLVVEESFERGLIIETCGPDDEIVKVFPPLTIEEDKLVEGLELMAAAVDAAVARA
ncbi:diaminobutyrate--2-oxoglutarate aminotransferase [gamma proteobacterium HTCC5015]|nr:diaminobutyrate--2-oxoglutarate aminotransferase [gamma proteobacterium HTCC5015]